MICRTCSTFHACFELGFVTRLQASSADERRANAENKMAKKSCCIFFIFCIFCKNLEATRDWMREKYRLLGCCFSGDFLRSDDVEPITFDCIFRAMLGIVSHSKNFFSFYRSNFNFFTTLSIFHVDEISFYFILDGKKINIFLCIAIFGAAFWLWLTWLDLID